MPLTFIGFPGGLDGKESTCNAGDVGLIPGSGRSPGEGNSNPLQYSCLENSTDRGAYGLPFMGSQTVDTTERLTHTHTHTHTHTYILTHTHTEAFMRKGQGC